MPATSLKCSKIYITLKMSLGRVFERYFLFLFFTRKMKIEAISTNCHMFWRLSHQNYSFKYNTKIYTQEQKKPHTFYYKRRHCFCCKVINSRYIKLQKLITFGIQLYLRYFQSCSNFSHFQKLNYGYWQQQDVN